MKVGDRVKITPRKDHATLMVSSYRDTEGVISMEGSHDCFYVKPSDNSKISIRIPREDLTLIRASLRTCEDDL